MSLKGKLRVGEGGLLFFWCSGCKEAHGVTSVWSFNGDYDKPTFSPSVLITSGHYSHPFGGTGCWCTYNKEHPDNPAPFKCDVCHSFLRDGRIEFLSDCTHELAGKIVDLEVFPS